MKKDKLYEAFNYIDDWYLDIVDTPNKETTKMKKTETHISFKRTISVLLAAALCASILTVTAMAAGWIPNIFASVEPVFPEDAEVLNDAIEATQEQIVETYSVPEVDFTQFTLYERYYDGESILLGYDLSKIMPSPVVGYRPDNTLFAKIKEMPEYLRATAPELKDDTLESRLALGLISQEEYETALNNRSDYAKKFDLRKSMQLQMDWEMKNILSPEQYAQFWKILTETGSCCVAVPAQPWIADHVYVNDTDCGEVLGPDCGNFRVDYSTDVGECMLLKPLPEAGRNQESVTVKLALRSGWYYWYMELNGDVYCYFENNPVHEASFTLENVNN